jgi:hypothetical protein
MNDKKDIIAFTKLNRLISIFQRISQISWTSDQTRKRYPAPEMMTSEEMQALTRSYLALGFDIEQAYQDWLKEYKENAD